MTHQARNSPASAGESPLIARARRFYGSLLTDFDSDSLAGLFIEDAVWDGSALGYAEGREAIREFFRNAPATVSFAVHTVTNPLIEIDGDRATGRWYLWQPMVLRDGNACMWLCAQYDDRYLRTADGWKFERVKITIRAFSPYEEGFGKTLVAGIPESGN